MKIKDREGNDHDVRLIKWREVYSVSKLNLDVVNYAFELLRIATSEDDRVETCRRFDKKAAFEYLSMLRQAICDDPKKAVTK